mgnify:FL=1
MSNESMNHIKELVERAYYDGAVETYRATICHIQNYPSLGQYQTITALHAEVYAMRVCDNEKAPRCANSERPESEEATRNLQDVPTTPGASAQLPPLAADLEGLAVSLGVLAGKVSAEEWEFLKIFRANLRAAAERVAALENALEVPHA